MSAGPKPTAADRPDEAWLEDCSLMPLLRGERQPRIESFGEPDFAQFAIAAERSWHRPIVGKLREIEDALNARRVSLRELFPWTAMKRELHLLGEWKKVKIPRGRRPKKDVRRDLDRVAALLNSERISSTAKVILSGEHAYLMNLARRPSDDFKVFPAALLPLDPILSPPREVRREIRLLIKRANKWHDELPPFGWTRFIRTAHALLLRHGFSKTEATEVLCVTLLVIFPQWWPAGDKSDPLSGPMKRLRSLLKYRSRPF